MQPLSQAPSEGAARYAGIPTGRVIVSAYVICAVLTAIAAIYFAMYTRWMVD